MLTVAEIQAELSRINYKPGWSFTAYEGRWEGAHLAITATVPDSYHLGQMVTLDVHSMLPPMADARQLHTWLAWRLGRIEVHEMREFLRLDGRILFDPHAEFADRDQDVTVTGRRS